LVFDQRVILTDGSGNTESLGEGIRISMVTAINRSDGMTAAATS